MSIDPYVPTYYMHVGSSYIHMCAVQMYLVPQQRSRQAPDNEVIKVSYRMYLRNSTITKRYIR